MKKFTGGNFVEWLLIAVAVSVVIFALLVPTVLKKNFSGLSSSKVATTTSPAKPSQVKPSKPAPHTSLISSPSVSSSLSLGKGNAERSYQPDEEYVTIENNGQTAVDITGYKLENGKGSRVYAVGSSAVKYASDTAIIPQGARIIAPSGPSIIGDIILKPGEKAIVTSGRPGDLTTYKLVSFKENKCTGYFVETYRLTPAISKSCIAPDKEPGVSGLDGPCQDFLDRVSTCHAPKFDTVDKNGHTVDSDGNTCNGCVDGTGGLTQVCTAFIRAHYNYAGCLVYHAMDANFESPTWRVYLYRSWEMWASSRETISLYDRTGQLVDSISYQ